MDYMACGSIVSRKIQNFFKENFSDIRAPLHGGIEISDKCNFSCVHCYNDSSKKRQDLSTDQIKRLVNELVEEGAITIFLTGGEAMLHKDFDEIYKYIRMKGVFVSVLSNCSKVDQKKIDLFLEHPPLTIDISLYGITESTYEKITRVPGSYDAVMNGIKLLHDNHIPFSLKTVVMKENLAEVEKMKSFAKSLNVSFKYSSNIRLTNDRDIEPVSHAISIEEALSLDVSDHDRKAFFERQSKKPPTMTIRKKSRKVYLCEIGQNSFFISSDGILYGCVRERMHGYDLLKGSIKEGWYEYVKKTFMDKEASDNYPCLNCTSLKYCEQCPAQFELANGDPEKPISYICDLAHRRKLLFG